MKFNEGEIHEFSVLKRLEVPEEGEFYLLRHKTGRRLMLPLKTYKHYGIDIGQTIECRIDKVNCTGKVYLEPKHPVYEEGGVYQFKVSRISQGLDGKHKLVLKDCFDNQIEVFISKILYKPGDIVELTVDRIKKGIPLVFFPTIDHNSLSLKKELVDRCLHFEVKEIYTNSEGDELYVLEDKEHNYAEIKLKHYKKYGFTVGDTIDCNVYGVESSGRLKVEPLHPHYAIGEKYLFNVYGTENSLTDESLKILIVKDMFDNKCGMPIKNETNIHQTHQVSCRVLGFRKGRPKLEPSED